MKRLISRDSFVEKAIELGAAYILAPDAGDHNLVNYGSLVIPDATLKNGSVINHNGLLESGASVDLDGVNDFIDTGWGTRTNLIPNPNFGGEATTGYAAGTGVTISFEKYAGQYHCMKVVTDGKSSDQGVSLSPDPVVDSSGTYVFVPLIIANNGQKLACRLWASDGEVGNTEETLEGKGLATVVAAAVERKMSATTTHADCRVSTGAGVSVATTFRIFGFLLVKASKSELEAEYGEDKKNWFFPYREPLGSFLPKAPGKLSTGNCGWTGAENNSPSDIGPFARGTARTSFITARRTSIKNSQLFSAGDFEPAVRLTETPNEVWFKQVEGGGGEVWAKAWGDLNEISIGALMFNDPTNTLSWYKDGLLVSSVAEALTYDPVHGPSLLIGGTGGESTCLKGSVLPFAVFLKELTPEEIKSLSVISNSIAIRRELIPDTIGLRVMPPGAEPRRWAEDEPGAGDVLSDITLTDEIPGGCAASGGTLGRDPRTDYSDIVPFSKAYFYGAGVEKLWEGYFDKAPEVSGDQMSIAPALVGNQKHLEGNKGIKLGFIDSDLTKWGDGSTQRKIEVIGFYQTRNVETEIGFKDAGSTAAGIIFRVSFEEGHPLGEQWYYSDGVPIGKVKYDFNNLSGALAEFHDILRISTNDLGGGVTAVGPDHGNVTALNQELASSSNRARYAMVQSFYEGAYAGAGTDSKAWTNLRVLGNHGMTPKGVWPNIGYTAKQMLGYAVPLFAKPLRVDEDYIDDDGYIIPQAWYPDSNMGDVVRDVTKYGLYDWFVYFDNLFQLRKPGTYGRFWKAYVGESGLNEVGMDSERLWESIIVQYTDVDGSTRRVGPPGSGADVEDERLRITDPEHPAVKAELTRRDVLDLRGIGTPETAIAVGIRFLEEANLLPRSGSAKLTGYVLDDRGIMRPASHVRSGDWISFVDASDRGFRKIIKKTYTRNDSSADIDIDAPATGLEALLERLQVGLIALGLS